MILNLIALIVLAVCVVVVYYLVVSKKSSQQDEQDNNQDGGALKDYLPSFANNSQVDDSLNKMSNSSQLKPTESVNATHLPQIKPNSNVLPYPQVSNNYGPQQNAPKTTGTQPSLNCYPKDTVTPQELMPKEDPYNAWEASNPAVSGHLTDRNFLESGHHFGIDTVSNSLKNPNLQVRSDPVIPQVAVGPWQQSTISPDTNHRQFEIGGDY
jgi:hypothetical protein